MVAPSVGGTIRPPSPEPILIHAPHPPTNPARHPPHTNTRARPVGPPCRGGLSQRCRRQSRSNSLRHQRGRAACVARPTCSATVTSAPNISCSRPMSHLEPSDTKISLGLRPTCGSGAPRRETAKPFSPATQHSALLLVCLGSATLAGGSTAASAAVRHQRCAFALCLVVRDCVDHIQHAHVPAHLLVQPLADGLAQLRLALLSAVAEGQDRECRGCGAAASAPASSWQRGALPASRQRRQRPRCMPPSLTRRARSGAGCSGCPPPRHRWHCLPPAPPAPARLLTRCTPPGCPGPGRRPSWPPQ